MTRTPNVVVGLAAAKDRLMAAHRELAAQGADLGPLTSVLEVALELDGMLRSLGEELRHAKATASGLGFENARLRAEVRSAEDELGWLRPENAGQREQLRVLPSQIADRIRAELVCCDQYDRTHDGLTYEQSKAAVAALVNSRGYHDICFWSEAAARLAEGRADAFVEAGAA